MAERIIAPAALWRCAREQQVIGLNARARWLNVLEKVDDLRLIVNRQEPVEVSPYGPECYCIFNSVHVKYQINKGQRREGKKCFFIYLLSRNLAKCCTTNKLLKIIHNKQGHV